jgi:hypothetical protein
MPDSPSFTIDCIQATPYTLVIEPWGTEYRLEPGDFVRIAGDALLTGGVEVSVERDIISVTIWSEENLLLSNRAGEQIKL